MCTREPCMFNIRNSLNLMRNVICYMTSSFPAIPHSVNYYWSGLFAEHHYELLMKLFRHASIPVNAGLLYFLSQLSVFKYFGSAGLVVV